MLVIYYLHCIIFFYRINLLFIFLFFKIIYPNSHFLNIYVIFFLFCPINILRFYLHVLLF